LRHVTTAFCLLLLATGVRAEEERLYKPCGAKLDSLSARFGAAGSKIILYGEWGEELGEKHVSLNKGTSHPVEVIDFSPTALTVRLPADVRLGRYKIGVYCNPLDHRGGTYSTTWHNFRVLSSKSAKRLAKRRGKRRVKRQRKSENKSRYHKTLSQKTWAQKLRERKQRRRNYTIAGMAASLLLVVIVLIRWMRREKENHSLPRPRHGSR
jgi:hypothetical protein